MSFTFENKYFQKRSFAEKSVKRYFNNALKDVHIAQENTCPEVIFKFSYDALIKSGISLIAFYGYKTKSRQGHHIKILEKMAQIIKNNDIESIGDRMRRKRNLDLYDGGVIISKKEADGYLEFIKSVIINVESHIINQDSLI